MRVPQRNTVHGLAKDRAAPAGGAWKRGRGCLLVLLTLCGPAVADEAVILPSGLEASLQEVLSDPTGERYRFRFVAPGIGDGALGGMQLATDMQHLCDAVAVPHLANTDVQEVEVVVSLAEQATEFGVATPEIRQVFEMFSVRDARCIWEAF